MMNIFRRSFGLLLIVFLLLTVASQAQINTPAGATNPFGSNLSYGYGVMPTNLPSSGTFGRSQDAADAYNEWKSFYVDQTCAGGTQARVKFDDVNVTVSEGIAYGMLLAVYAADKALFDKFWAYYKANSNGNNIMNWKINGCSGVGGSGGATDAEFDAAMALIIAEKQWPLINTPYDYGVEASNLITKTRIHEMDNTTYQAINGDGWGFGNTCRNPSYQSPAYYRAYATHNPSEATFWNNAIPAAYTLINNNAHATTGLVSDWSDNYGNKNTCNGGYDGFGYDACRNPWRMAVDVLWWNNTNGKNICNKLATYINGQGVGNVRGPRNLDGSGGGYHNATFVSMYGVAVMGTSAANQTLMNNMYNEVKNTKDNLQNGYPSGYFGNTLRCVSLFAMTGNFWVPTTVASQEINIKAQAVDVLHNTTFDFQNVQNATTKDVTFTIENKGSAVLNITTPLTVTGTNFSILTQPSTSSLAGGATTTFVIRFTPGSNGVKTGSISIANNDADENPYVINLTGRGTATATNPEIEVIQNAVSISSGGTSSFGGVTQGGTRYLLYTINNTGDAPLNITSASINGTGTTNGFSLETSPAATVAAGGNTTFLVKFTPVSAGAKTGVLTINNNDADEGTFTINLSGTAQSCSASIASTDVIQDYDANNNVSLPFFPDGAFSEIENPFKNTANPSYTVAEYQRSTGQDYDVIRYDACGTNFTLTAGKPIISILVYSKQPGVPITISAKRTGAVPLLGAGNYGGDKHQVTTKVNQWERLYFDFSNVVSSTNLFAMMDIMIDPQRTKLGTTVADRTYLIDDIRFSANPCLTDLPTSLIFNDFEDHKNLTMVFGPSAPNTLNQATANLSATGLNTSAIVANFYRSATADYSSVRYSACNNGTFDLSAGKTVISMLVYSANAGAEILMSLKNSGGTEIGGARAKTTQVNTWEKLYFDFTSIQGNTTISLMDIFPDPLRESPAANYYFDEIKYDVNPCYAGISATGVMQDFNANRFLMIHNVNAGFNDFVVNPSATGINTSSHVGRLNRPATGIYNLIRYKPCGTSFDLSPGKTIYAMDVYSPVANLPIKMMLKKANGTTTLVEDSVVVVGANAWTTVKFDFSSALASDEGAFLDIYIDPTIARGANTYYIDNIRFADPEPEINVRQNTTTILTGGAFNMGTVNVGESSSIISFTIQNNGTGNLTLSGSPRIQISGTNAADFVIDQSITTATVGPVSSTIFTVTFTPAAEGAKTAVISIANNDSNENPYVINLTGTAVGVPEIDIKQGVTAIANAGTYDFGSVNVSTSSGATAFTIENLGSTTLNLTGTPTRVVLSGTDASQFTVVQPSVSAIAVGGTTTFTVAFNPTSTGTKTATLTIASNDADEPSYVITITGTGTVVPLPEINVTVSGSDVLTSTTHNMGALINGTSGTAVTFVIENQGTEVLNLTGTPSVVALSGTNAADFVLTQPSSSTVAAGGSTSFTVTFAPSAVGTRTAVLTIANDDANENPYVINLTGSSTATAVPEINVTVEGSNVLTAASYNMGSVVNGTSGTAVTFVVENQGTEVLNLTGTPSVVVLSGTNAADFVLTQPSSSTVAAGGSTSFTVTFAPSAIGTRTAVLTIANDDDDENPYVINLTATGTTAPAPEINVQQSTANYLTGSLYTFGNQEVTTSSFPVTFTIYNTGSAPLNISNVVLSGAGSASFSLDQSSMAATVAAGSSTTISLTFTPSAAGTATAALVISSNDDDEATYTVNLSGTGTLATGINEALAASARLSPNPFSESFTLELGTMISGPVEVRVKNLLGEDLQHSSVNGASDLMILMHNSPAGVYVVEIQTTQGNIVKRIIKQ